MKSVSLWLANIIKYFLSQLVANLVQLSIFQVGQLGSRCRDFVDPLSENHFGAQPIHYKARQSQNESQEKQPSVYSNCADHASEPICPNVLHQNQKDYNPNEY